MLLPLQSSVAGLGLAQSGLDIHQSSSIWTLVCIINIYSQYLEKASSRNYSLLNVPAYYHFHTH